MVENLKETNLDFDGQAAQGWCFLHTMNLTAKVLMCLFDPRQGGRGADMEDRDVNELASSLREEEEVTQRETVQRDGDTDGEIQDDNNNGWVDNVSALTEGERKELMEMIKPVKLALMKVELSIYLLNQHY